MILAKKKKNLILQIWTLMKSEDDVQVHKPENIQEFQISKIISKCLCTFKVKIIHIVCFFSFSVYMLYCFGYHEGWWFCIILQRLCSKCLHSSMIRNKTHAMAWDWSKRHHAWTMNLSEETTETFSHLQWLVSHLPKKKNPDYVPWWKEKHFQKHSWAVTYTEPVPQPRRGITETVTVWMDERFLLGSSLLLN